jgi:hypothetical protein
MATARKNMFAPAEEWVSLLVAARELGCSRQGVLTSIVAGELVSDHRAGRTTVSRLSLDALKTRREITV